MIIIILVGRTLHKKGIKMSLKVFQAPNTRSIIIDQINHSKM